MTKYVLKYGNKSVTLSGSATKYVIYGLNKGTYSYSMIAYDAAGNASKAKTGKITINEDGRSAIIKNGKSPKEALVELMTRDLKCEIE